jgi:hypothetical protein
MIEETLKQYKERIEASMLKVKTLQQLRDEDTMIDEVFIISREIFDKDLDRMNLNELVSKGGTLASIYGYLGNKYARIRAERDVAEQKRDEIFGDLTISLYEKAEGKITLAKELARKEMPEIEEDLVIKEYEKKNFEQLLSSVDRLIGFIQSAIKVKQAERYTGRELSDGVG